MLCKLILKDPWLIVLFGLSLLGFLFCNMNISIACSINVNWAKFMKDLILAVSGSYIAGYLFYVFSVLLPKSKQLPPIYEVMCQQVLYAKSALMELSYDVTGAYEFNADALRSKLAGERLADNSVNVTPDNCSRILQSMNNVYLLIQYPMSKIELLHQENLENLCEVLKQASWLIARIKDVHPNPMYFSNEDYNKFIDAITKVYNLLEKTYKNLGKE